MIKTIYANGCSWTAGNGIEQDPLFQAAAKKPFSQVRAELGSTICEHAWPAHLAKILQVDNVVNEALGGGSNARAFRTTLNHVSRLSLIERRETLVVIGWTTIERGEIYIPDKNLGGWYRFNVVPPFDDYLRDFPSERVRALNKYHELFVTELYDDAPANEAFFNQVFALGNALENLEVPYLFFSSLNLGLRQPARPLPEAANELNLIDISFSFERFVRERNLPMSTCIHPLVESHTAWADHLALEIHQRGILS